jgi:AcrR family transcriptional regulator
MNDSRSRPAGTRERLIETSARLFAEHGFDGVSVRRIARASKVNLGAVTYHFGGKEELFGEVVARKAEDLRALGTRIVNSRKPPDAKLSDMLRIYAFRMMHEDPGLKMLFAETIAGGARLPQAAIDGMAWRNRMFADIVREGVKKGIFRKCDVECLSWNFFEMLSSYILCQALMERVKGAGRMGKGRAYSKAYVKRVVDAALDVFLNGLKTKGKS